MPGTVISKIVFLPEYNIKYRILPQCQETPKTIQRMKWNSGPREATTLHRSKVALRFIKTKRLRRMIFTNVESLFVVNFIILIRLFTIIAKNHIMDNFLIIHNIMERCLKGHQKIEADRGLKKIRLKMNFRSRL